MFNCVVVDSCGRRGARVLGLVGSRSEHEHRNSGGEKSPEQLTLPTGQGRFRSGTHLIPT